MVANSPISDRHTHLLAAYLALRFDLPALATQENLSATELLEFVHALEPHLQDLKKALQDSLELQSLSAKSAALHTLETLTKSSENPQEQRRAAAHILRGLSTRPQPQSEPSGASRRSTPESRDVTLGTRHPAPLPSPHSATLPLCHSATSSQPTAQQILSAACNPLAPDSAATIHAHLSPDATINDQPVATPADIPPLLSELSTSNPVREVTLSAPATSPDHPNLHAYCAELTHQDDQISHLALILTNAHSENWKLQSLYNDTG